MPLPVTGFGEALAPEYAALLGFVPTSTSWKTSNRWRGKYRCQHCKSNGYVTLELLDVPQWWGLRHGDDCRRKHETP